MDDAAAFRDVLSKVFHGAGQVVCYVGLLRGYRRLREAMADQVIATFLSKYLAAARLQ